MCLTLAKQRSQRSDSFERVAWQPAVVELPPKFGDVGSHPQRSARQPDDALFDAEHGQHATSHHCRTGINLVANCH